MRDALSVPIVAALGYVAATTAIFLVPWEGVAAVVVLAVVHVALGLAVGRWWVLPLPIPLLAILLAPSTGCSGDLCGNDFYAFFLAWYAGVGCALVAVGVGAHRLLAPRWDNRAAGATPRARSGVPPPRSGC